MSLKGLSERALLLLRLVASRTDRDWGTGEVRRFYVPGARTEYVTLPGGKLVDIDVGGSGDAMALKALERRGLIEPRRTAAYSYALTEEGRLALTRLDEQEEGGAVP